MTYEQAFKKMPMALVGGHDPLAHTTLEDLAWLAQHELDLYDEGEESDIRNRRERAVVERYLKQCQAAAAHES